MLAVLLGICISVAVQAQQQKQPKGVDLIALNSANASEELPFWVRYLSEYEQCFPTECSIEFMLPYDDFGGHALQIDADIELVVNNQRLLISDFARYSQPWDSGFPTDTSEVIRTWQGLCFRLTADCVLSDTTFEESRISRMFKDECFEPLRIERFHEFSWGTMHANVCITLKEE